MSVPKLVRPRIIIVTINHGGAEFRGHGVNNSGVLVSPLIVGAGGPEYAGKPKAVDEPMRTVMSENHRSLVAGFLAKHYGGVVGHDPQRPLGTITAIDHHSVIASHVSYFNRGDRSVSDARDPMRTITACGFHAAEVRAFLTKYYGHGGGQEIDAPLHTITSKDRLGVVTVAGQEYQIVDIGLRMLAPRELLRAQFGKYAKDYILTGTKSQQVARIGNSVPPELAEAIVRANYNQPMTNDQGQTSISITSLRRKLT